MKSSRIEVEVTCARCNFKDVLNTIMSEYETSAQLDWSCPMCKARRTVIIKKTEPEKSTEINPKKVTNFLMNKGQKMEVDEYGNPVHKGAKFPISAPKKKVKEIGYSKNVSVIDED